MKLFDNRLVLSFMLGIGSLGIVCLVGVVGVSVANHRAFPTAFILGSIQWCWCTVWAGQRLFRRDRKPEADRTPIRTF